MSTFTLYIYIYIVEYIVEYIIESGRRERRERAKTYNGLHCIE
jgi:hypothetical protein